MKQSERHRFANHLQPPNHQVARSRRPQAPRSSPAAYLVTEVLRGDAEDVQAHGGLLELGLQDLQLKVLLLAALPQLPDQSPVQLLAPLRPVGRAPARCTATHSVQSINQIHSERLAQLRKCSCLFALTWSAGKVNAGKY